MTKKASENKFTKSYEFMLLVVVLALILILALATGGKSIQAANIIDILTSYSAYGVISIGCLFVIISGGIDISFMAVAAVAQYVMALFMLNIGGNFITSYLICAAVGAALGLVNAVLVNRLKVPTMIITIGTMNIIYGIMMKASNGKRLHGFPQWFSSKTKVSLFLVSVGTLAAGDRLPDPQEDEGREEDLRHRRQHGSCQEERDQRPEGTAVRLRIRRRGCGIRRADQMLPDAAGFHRSALRR